MAKKDGGIRLFHTRGDVFLWRLRGVFSLFALFAPRRTREREDPFSANGDPIYLTYTPEERKKWAMRAPWVRALLALEAILAVAILGVIGVLYWREIADGVTALWGLWVWFTENAPTWFEEWLDTPQRS